MTGFEVEDAAVVLTPAVQCSDHHRWKLEQHSEWSGAMFARALQRVCQCEDIYRAPGRKFHGPIASGSWLRCGTVPLFGQDHVGVEQSREPGGYSVRFGVMQCKTLICPVCCRPKMLEKASKTGLAVRRALDQGKGVYLGAFTVRHAAGDEMQSMFDMLMVALNKMRETRKYRDLIAKVGAGRMRLIYSIEVTWGENGFHVHIQFAAFFERPLSRGYKMDDGSPVSRQNVEKIADCRSFAADHAAIPKHEQKGRHPRALREAIRMLRKELFADGCWNEYDYWTTTIGELWRDAVVKASEAQCEGSGKNHAPDFLIGVDFAEISDPAGAREVGRYLLKQGLRMDTKTSELGIGFEVATGGMFKKARKKGNFGPFALLTQGILDGESEKIEAYRTIQRVLQGKKRWAVGLSQVLKWLDVTDEDIEEWMTSDDEDPEIALHSPDWIEETVVDLIGTVDKTVWFIGTQKGLDFLLIQLLSNEGGRFVEAAGQKAWIPAYEFVRCWLADQWHGAQGCRRRGWTPVHYDPGEPLVWDSDTGTTTGKLRWKGSSWALLLQKLMDGLEGFTLPPGWGLVREADGFLPCPLDEM